jgi:hypothetical protein
MTMWRLDAWGSLRGPERAAGRSEPPAGERVAGEPNGTAAAAAVFDG